jgi:hypothetical protein
LIGGIPTLAAFGSDAAIPAFIDLKPGSEFQTQLNGTYEPFSKAGIQSYPSRFLVEWRLLGDQFFGRDAGRTSVKVGQFTLGVTTVCSAVGWMIGKHDTATKCALTAGGMLVFDGLWNGMVANLGKSDGIVPGSSQVYPNTPRNYAMRDGAPSHTGETDSEETRKTLRPVLRDVMGVPSRGAF